MENNAFVTLFMVWTALQNCFQIHHLDIYFPSVSNVAGC